MGGLGSGRTGRRRLLAEDMQRIDLAAYPDRKGVLYIGPDDSFERECTTADGRSLSARRRLCPDAPALRRPSLVVRLPEVLPALPCALRGLRGHRLPSLPTAVLCVTV